MKMRKLLRSAVMISLVRGDPIVRVKIMICLPVKSNPSSATNLKKNYHTLVLKKETM